MGIFDRAKDALPERQSRVRDDRDRSSVPAADPTDEQDEPHDDIAAEQQPAQDVDQERS